MILIVRAEIELKYWCSWSMVFLRISLVTVGEASSGALKRNNRKAEEEN